MDTLNILKIVEVIISVLVIISILLQQKEGGLGTTFGGGSAGEGFRTKRGLELLLSRATVVLVIALVINSLAIAYL